MFWFASLVNYLQTQGMTKDQAVQLFKDIAANSAITDGHTATADLVVAGQYGIAANIYIARIRELQAKGAPLEFTPVQVPVVAEVTTVAATCDAANPAGALLLQDFILGPEGQQAFIEDSRTPSNEALAAESFGGVKIEPIDSDVETISEQYRSGPISGRASSTTATRADCVDTCRGCTPPVASSAVGRRHAERVPVRVGEHHPREVAEAVPAGLRRAELDEPLDFGLHVVGAEVDVHPVLARRWILDLLESQTGTLRTGHGDENGGAMGFTCPSSARAHQSASRSGSVVSNVMFSVLSAMRRP